MTLWNYCCIHQLRREHDRRAAEEPLKRYLSLVTREAQILTFLRVNVSKSCNKVDYLLEDYQVLSTCSFS